MVNINPPCWYYTVYTKQRGSSHSTFSGQCKRSYWFLADIQNMNVPISCHTHTYHLGLSVQFLTTQTLPSSAIIQQLSLFLKVLTQNIFLPPPKCHLHLSFLLLTFVSSQFCPLQWISCLMNGELMPAVWGADQLLNRNACCLPVCSRIEARQQAGHAHTHTHSIYITGYRATLWS